MADFYTYLIASLPMLHFGTKPPFSFTQFLEMCKPFIPDKDFQLLNNLPQPEQYTDKIARPRIIQRWIAFDISLRNELAKLRANQKHLEFDQYLRPDGSIDSSITSVVMTIYMQTSPLGAEKILDEARWKYLEDLAIGHHFDRDLLIIYAYKLLLLQRWENIRNADTNVLLKQIYSINGV